MFAWLKNLFKNKVENKSNTIVTEYMIILLCDLLINLINTHKVKRYKCIRTFLKKNEDLYIFGYSSKIKLISTTDLFNSHIWNTLTGYGFRRFVHDWNFLHCTSNYKEFNDFMVKCSNKQ